MITNSVYKMAAYFVETCRFSVIPLKPGSKEPSIPWREYQKRLPTMEELKKWFQHTQNNIGIVTGVLSGIAVLDVDSMEMLQKLNTITSSITVLTRKGRHLYFKYTGETNSASKIAESIDVRGEGGFVVAPCSIVDGHRYRFLSSYVSPVLLRPFPRELLGGSDEVKEIKRNPEGWITEAVNTIESGGPRTPNFVRLIGRYHYDGHSPDDIFSLLKPLAASCNHDLDKLRGEIDDITKKEGKRSATGYEIHTEGDTTEDFETFLEGEETVEWLVPKIVAKKGFGLCAGLPETFKSWILIDLAIECARGGEWLGHKVEKCKVMFIEQERFKGEIKERFRKMLKGKNLKPKDVKDNLRAQSGTSTKFDLPTSFEAFKRKLDEFKPDLLILDSFVTFHQCSENERNEIQKILEKVKELRSEYGCAIWFVDHEGKSVLNPETRGDTPNAFKIMGSVGKPAAAEIVLTVRKDKADSVTVYNTKNSLAQAAAPISLQIRDTDDGGIVLVKL